MRNPARLRLAPFVLVLLLSGCWEGEWRRDVPVLVSGPDLGRGNSLFKMYEGGETKTEVTETLGDPIFTFPTSRGEVLIYRTLEQDIAKRERFFGLIEDEIYYTSIERILLLEFVDGRVAAHKSIYRSYPRPAGEVEFGLNDSLPEFIHPDAYAGTGATWSTGGAKP